MALGARELLADTFEDGASRGTRCPVGGKGRRCLTSSTRPGGQHGEKVCYENMAFPGRAHGTHPQHPRQVGAVMPGATMVTCTRRKRVLQALLVITVPARLSQTVPSPLTACRVLTPSRSWSSWWGGGWAGPAAGGCPAPRCGCPPAGRGRWATPVTWGSAGAALLVGRWGPMTWWGRRAPPFWGRAGGQQEKGRPGARVCCL